MFCMGEAFLLTIIFYKGKKNASPLHILSIPVKMKKAGLNDPPYKYVEQFDFG